MNLIEFVHPIGRIIKQEGPKGLNKIKKTIPSELKGISEDLFESRNRETIEEEFNTYTKNILNNIKSKSLRKEISQLTNTAIDLDNCAIEYTADVDKIIENASLLDPVKDKKIIAKTIEYIKEIEKRFQKMLEFNEEDEDIIFELLEDISKLVDKTVLLEQIPAKSRGSIMGITGRVRKALGKNPALKENSEDLADAMKIEDIEELITTQNYKEAKTNNEKELENFIYNKYFLPTFASNKKAQMILRKINKKYGTKVFVPSNTSSDALDDILGEFNAWNRAGKDKVKYETTLSYDDFNNYYYQASCDGFTSLRDGSIHIKKRGLDPITEFFRHILRHEKMHLNNTGCSPDMKTNFNKVKDQKEYFRDELKKAGLDKHAIEYAYTNESEFISVAAEGKPKSYSEKFREILIKMGMPEYFFDMTPYRSRHYRPTPLEELWLYMSKKI